MEQALWGLHHLSWKEIEAGQMSLADTISATLSYNRVCCLVAVVGAWVSALIRSIGSQSIAVHLRKTIMWVTVEL